MLTVKLYWTTKCGSHALNHCWRFLIYNAPTHFSSACRTACFPGTGAVLFVDYANGADSNDGSQAKPFKTISKAVATAEGMSPGVTINLRAGTHYVLDTVQFSAKASSVTIQNYNGESAHWIRKSMWKTII